MLARGVDSVSSPIANVRVGNGEFEGAVVGEFEEMYGGVEVVEVGGEEIEGVEEIRKGVKELRVCLLMSRDGMAMLTMIV